MNRILALAAGAAAIVVFGVLIAPLFTPSSEVRSPAGEAPDAAPRAELHKGARAMLAPPALDASSAEAPRDEKAPREAPPPPPADESESALAGLEVDEANAGTLRDLKVPEGMTGVIITAVDPASPSAEASLEKGDVIVRAQREKITTLESLKTAVGDRGQTVLTVYRGGYPFQVVLHKPFKGDR
jgi:hypothetical protein